MPTTVTAPIVLDDQGVAFIEGTAIKVLELVRTGQTPEAIRADFPHLTMAQIYAALSYYHQHKEELDAEIERRDRLVEQLQAEAGEHPFARRMQDAGRLP